MFLNAGNPYATVVIPQRKFQKPPLIWILQRYPRYFYALLAQNSLWLNGWKMLITKDTLCQCSKKSLRLLI